MPVALLLLSLVPVTAGVLRIVEIFGGPQLLPANPRVDASPAPVVVHVVAAASYALAGAFQFSVGLRRRHPGWHRKAGRGLVGAGLVVAVSGLWLTLRYPGAPGGAWLWTVRLVVGSAMGASLVAGLAAIRRRDIVAHRAWMIRAYALGLGAGTQVLTEGLGEAALGIGGVSKAVSLTAGWIINAVVAEWAIHCPVLRRRRTAPLISRLRARAPVQLVPVLATHVRGVGCDSRFRPPLSTGGADQAPPSASTQSPSDSTVPAPPVTCR